MSEETPTPTPDEDARENEHERDDDHDHQSGEEQDEATAPPADLSDDEVLAAAVQRFDEVVAHDSRGQAVAYVPAPRWKEFATWLRDEQQFEICADLCGVDHLLNARRPVPDGVTPERFEVVANFLSRKRRRRLRAICPVPSTEPVIDSISTVYPGVDYSERETFDLFGLRFEGHSDLSRILLPEDWEGYPLRKDDAPARVPVQFKGAAETPFQQALPRTPVAEGGDDG